MKTNKRLLWILVPALLLAGVTAGVLVGRLTAKPAAKGCKVQPPPAAAESRPPQRPLSTQEKKTLAAQDNTPIVRVEGKAVPRWMFANALHDRLAGKSPSEEELHQIEDKTIDNLVGMELLSSEAARLGLAAGEAGGQLRLAIVERSYKSPEAFNQSLAEAGMTRQQYADLWRQQAAVNRLVDEKIKPGVIVTKQELEQMYQEEKKSFQRPPRVRASHILIKVDEKATEQERAATREKAERLRSQLRQGADFAALAREHSACPSAHQGGDLGWFDRGKMDPAFSEATFALAKDALSDVVATSFGYHIILKTDERPAGPASLDEVRGELTEAIRKAKTKVALDRYLAELRTRADIEIYDHDHDHDHG